MFYTVFLAATVSLLFIGDQADPASNTKKEVSVGPPAGYTLVWHDEFNGNVLDKSKWRHRALGPRRDAVNVSDAVSLDGNGHLLITTSKVGDEWHTGMISTAETFQTTFGYFEAKIRLQTQVGHWSAFWLQTPDMGKFLGDPARAGVEIDVIEYLRNGRNKIIAHHNLHWDGYGKQHKHAGTKVKIPALDDGRFHVFALQWTPEEYVFFVDGRETWRTRAAVSHHPEFMLLSLEVGKWAGDIRKAKLPDSLVVDYVRVYKDAAKQQKQKDRNE